MLKTNILYTCKCNQCETIWKDEELKYFTTITEMLETVEDDPKWLTIDKKNKATHYCPECWEVDRDTDERVIKKVV